MKIVHLYKDYDPVVGGIENHIKLLAEAQVRRGHDVTVLVTSQGRRTERYTQKGVRIIKAARLAHVASTPLSLPLVSLLAQQYPDVLHLQFPYPMGEVATLLRGRGGALVVSYQSDVVRQAGLLRLYRPLMLRLLARADRLIASSPPYVESSAVLRQFRDKVSVVPLGTEISARQTAPQAQIAALRGRHAPNDEPLILFVGRFRYYKGVDVLLRAVPHLARGRVLLVGDGPERSVLERLHAELGLGERVRFLGTRPDEELRALRHAVRESGGLLVLPATRRSEAFGMVLIEGLAAGLPLVSTELGTGTSWVNQHDVTGLVVPPADPLALAAAIDRLLSDRETWQRFSENARQRAQRFDVTMMVDGVEAVYRQALAERS
jgi:rhamnosyl/mannosyltransferase